MRPSSRAQPALNDFGKPEGYYASDLRGLVAENRGGDNFGFIALILCTLQA
ncbi:MAG: hypothetical protein ABI728_09990 [Betaproteobacteria bacterium]